MSADCMNPLLDHYILNQQSACPLSLTDANYACLCAQSSFTSWYLSTLCINCNGAQILQSPLSNLTTLCPSFTTAIEAQYPNGCSPYAGSAATTRLSSSSSNLTPSETTSSSSSSSSTSSLSETTVVLTMTTPGAKLSTVTAVAASPFRPTDPIPISSSNSTLLSTSPTSSSPNATYTSTSAPTPQVPLTDSSSSSGMSTGAKAGIGVGAAAAVVGIGFFLISLLTILRRRNSRLKGSSGSTGYAGRGIGGGNSSGELGVTNTTLAETYQDDDSQLYRGFGGVDRYGSSGLGIAGIGTQREKMGLVPSGRITEVRVAEDGDPRGSEVAIPLHAEGAREIHSSRGEVPEERTSIYAEDENYAAPRGTEVWHSAVEEPGPWVRHSVPQDGGYDIQHEVGLQYSPARESAFRHDAESRYSTAHESNYEAAMRPKSRIYSVVDSPVLDLGQADLSREELERLEDEERRIDEAIRESESRARIRVERASGGIGKAL